VLSIGLILVAAGLRLASGIAYVFDILRGRARPNPITWFCWGLTASITLAAQIAEGVGIQALVTFAIALGPMAIFVVSILRSRDASSFTPANVTCGALALVGIVLWQLTDDPILAIALSILADIFGGIPTIVKAFKDPASEPTFPYLLTMASMALTVTTISHWQFATYAFPIYIFGINLVVFVLAWSKIGKRRKPLVVAVLDLRKIPATPDVLSPIIACFSAVDDAMASPPPEKTVSDSALATPGGCEVLRKSSVEPEAETSS
jgi:hypothetical protein